uniref:DUF148 domain-containing protein n=1 Tax=Caenorhabditis tropicalis TaxID=1561998 RepID=A0A1I7U7C2_9PELO
MTVKTRSTIAKKIEKEADAPEAQYLAVNPDEIIQLQEESKKIPYKREIVWRNVALFAALHFGAAIGLYQLIFEAKWATVLFSESFLHSLFLICYQFVQRQRVVEHFILLINLWRDSERKMTTN